MHLPPLRGDGMTPLRRFRFWIVEGYEVEMPSSAPFGTLMPKKLADVPPEWTRRPWTPPNPGRPPRR